MTSVGGKLLFFYMCTLHSSMLCEPLMAVLHPVIHNTKLLDLLFNDLFLMYFFNARPLCWRILRKWALEYLWHSSEDPNQAEICLHRSAY